MTLTRGTRLGSYEVQSALGVGGMGEVYRARDAKLGRDVAIKIVSDGFRNDPERVARFSREAQLLAQLNHPHIAAIHGFENGDGTPFIVLELVEGGTLAERLKTGPLPVSEALSVARQVADALQAAHEKGIVHRDLKPGNIAFTSEGRVKVLDFGLAKALEPDPSADLTNSPTFTRAPTEAGVILGTAAYMAPEQAKGRTADKRSDVWAFGAVLYEMLTGKRAFPGQDVSDTVASVLAREPDLGALPSAVPPAIRTLVQQCLVKDRLERIADISVARFLLSESASVAATAPSGTIAASERQGRRLLRWGVAAVAAIAMTVGAAWGVSVLRGGAGNAPLTRFVVTPPEGGRLAANPGAVVPVVSPDGRRVVFVAADPAGPFRLWVRPFDAVDAAPLEGTEGVLTYFWSPDSTRIAFYAAGALKVVDASGGPVQTLSSTGGGPAGIRGGAWNREGVIVFGTLARGLFRVPSVGGTPTPLTTLAAGETAHRYPSFLPDGRRFVYLSVPSNTVWLGSLDGAAPTRLLDADSAAQYGAPGYLLYVRQNTLMAHPFDTGRAALSGVAVPVAEEVAVDASGAAAFSVSETGVLAHRVGPAVQLTQLTWADRRGTRLGTVGPPGTYRNPALSPDSSRLAVEVTDRLTRRQDIWLVELARGVMSRFTFDSGNDVFPIWSPDGTWIMFGSDRGGTLNLYQKRATGVGDDELVAQSGSDMAPYGWAPDGQTVVYRTVGSSGSFSIGILPLAGTRTPRLFQQAKAVDSSAHISPSGRWMVYHSNESGRFEVYVQSFPAPGGGKWQISKDGGVYPRWTRNGQELVYYAPDGRLMTVSVKGNTALEVGSAAPLFNPNLPNGPNSTTGFTQQYDVARDGQRFLLNERASDFGPQPSITVSMNWTAGLGR